MVHFPTFFTPPVGVDTFACIVACVGSDISGGTPDVGGRFSSPAAIAVISQKGRDRELFEKETEK
jgi:hypothetical protein